jgi:tetratricopeptide (TPR) repeat protein
MALDLYRNVRHRHGEAIALNNLGRIEYLQGNFDPAQQVLEEALTIHRDLGHRYGEASVLNNLGRLRYLTGDQRLALEFLADAQRISLEIGDKHGEAEALANLGLVWNSLGEHERAKDVLEKAKLVYLRISDRYGVTEVLNCLGRLAIDGDSDYSGACRHYQDTLEAASNLQTPLEEARAAHGIAECLAELGDVEGFVKYLNRAFDIYRSLSAPELSQLESLLRQHRTTGFGTNSH